MSYDQKKGWESNWEFDSWLQTPWKQRSNELQFGMLYTVGKIFLRAIRYNPHISKIDLIWKRYERPKFWNNKSPNFGNLGEKWHLDVILVEKHKYIIRRGLVPPPKGYESSLWEIVSAKTKLTCNWIVTKINVQLGYNYSLEIRWINN
jgi:hypothetical protein